MICKSTYYAFTIDPEVRGFVRSLNKETVGKIVNFGSAAMLNSTYKKVKAEADKAGVPMDPREFHCRGEFKGLHKGRPNDDDLKAAEAFAKAICSDSPAEKRSSVPLRSDRRLCLQRKCGNITTEAFEDGREFPNGAPAILFVRREYAGEVL